MTIKSDPMFAPTKASAPYNGTAGYAPVEQSERAARQDVASGKLVARQRMILQMLDEAGPVGLTSAEIEKRTGEGHGKVSGVLSSMHKDGAITALKLDRRNGCGVYVLPQNVQGRIVRKFVSIEESKADRAPAPPPRPRLTDSEKELIAKVRANVKARPDGIVQILPSTARALLAAFDRLNR